MNHKIDASAAAKEILVLLAPRGYAGHTSLPDNMTVGTGLGRHLEQVYVDAWLEPADLEAPFEVFADRVALPIADALRRLDFIRPDMHFRELELPKGVDAAGESYRGLWLRVIVDDSQSLPSDIKAWSRKRRYYDPSTDEFVWGDCGICLRVDICPKGMRE